MKRRDFLRCSLAGLAAAALAPLAQHFPSLRPKVAHLEWVANGRPVKPSIFRLEYQPRPRRCTGPTWKVAS